MPRKTGKDTKIEVEVGTTYYAMAELTSVASPAADVRKKFATSATFLSDQEDLQPTVRLDGVISGLTIAPSSTSNAVDVAAGTAYIKGASVTVTADTITDLKRPTTSGQVKVTALSVDSDGTINKTAGVEGVTSTTRGENGAIPFIPVDEALIGYVTMNYYDGSASGMVAVTATEINDETKERSTIPSYQVLYYDGGGSNPQEVGIINFAAVLPLIHAATGAGPGTDARNVYASYYEPSFEELSEAKDFGFDEDITSIKSKAYGDEAEEAAIGTPSWTATGTVYWTKVQDVLTLIKNTKRWVRFYPDKDDSEYFAGRSIVKVSRSLPLEETISAAVSFEGSGSLYDIV